jgi:hypothetical protein
VSGRDIQFFDDADLGVCGRYYDDDYLPLRIRIYRTSLDLQCDKFELCAMDDRDVPAATKTFAIRNEQRKYRCALAALAKPIRIFNYQLSTGGRCILNANIEAKGERVY